MDYREELYHHGIKGQKWGVRRYQNDDGTLTNEGKSRYTADKIRKELNKTDRKMAKYRDNENIAATRKWKAYNKEKDTSKYDKKFNKNYELVEDAKDRTRTLLNLAKEKGYTVSTVSRTRYARTGQQVVANLVAGPFGNLAYSGYSAYNAYKDGPEAAGFVEGTEYSVKRK